MDSPSLRRSTFMTIPSVIGFRTFTELRDFVYATMCDREQFAKDAFPMSERVLKRGNDVCGYLFSIYGPRNVVCNAVFETRTNAIHFYSASGARVLSRRVSKAPELLMGVPRRRRGVG